jgi:hypothetical protein
LPAFECRILDGARGHDESLAVEARKLLQAFQQAVAARPPLRDCTALTVFLSQNPIEILGDGATIGRLDRDSSEAMPEDLFDQLRVAKSPQPRGCKTECLHGNHLLRTPPIVRDGNQCHHAGKELGDMSCGDFHGNGFSTSRAARTTRRAAPPTRLEYKEHEIDRERRAM